jgi:hypothetical protein
LRLYTAFTFVFVFSIPFLKEIILGSPKILGYEVLICSLQIFITDYFFKATLDDNFSLADIEVTLVPILAGLSGFVNWLVP